MDDLVSIIIPVYNIEDYVGACLESVLAQTYENLEIIVVDDGSTDGSNAIIRKFDDTRIKLFRNKNHGLGYSRNFGFKKATGKWIFHLDGDDYLRKDCIEKLLQAAYYKAQTPREMVICKMKNDYKHNTFEDENNNIKILNTSKSICKYLLLDPYKYDLTTFNSFGKLLDKNFVKTHNICAPEDIQHSEDLIFSIQCWENATNVAFVQQALYFYRFRIESISKSGRVPKESLQGRLYLSKHLLNIYRARKMIEEYPQVYSIGAHSLAAITIDLIRQKKCSYKSAKECLQIMFKDDTIKKCVHKHKGNSLFEKMLSFCARHHFVGVCAFFTTLCNKLHLFQEKLPVSNDK